MRVEANNFKTNHTFFKSEILFKDYEVAKQLALQLHKLNENNKEPIEVVIITRESKVNKWLQENQGNS